MNSFFSAFERSQAQEEKYQKIQHHTYNTYLPRKNKQIIIRIASHRVTSEGFISFASPCGEYTSLVRLST